MTIKSWNFAMNVLSCNVDGFYVRKNSKKCLIYYSYQTNDMAQKTAEAKQ